MLFKSFADLDVFDLEIDAAIRTTSSASAGCWNRLSAASTSRTSVARVFLHRGAAPRDVSIPVFHDDQHGTAIISGAALLNALEVVGQEID